MSDSELTPELVDLLKHWRGKLPTGTELNGTIHRDPGFTAITARQPALKVGRIRTAAVQITEEAMKDLGQIEAIEPALKILTDLAMRRGFPEIAEGDPALVVARKTSAGLELFNPPVLPSQIN